MLNCPITFNDIQTAEVIFGSGVGLLKSKTVQVNPDAVQPIITPIPSGIQERYGNITLCTDIMFVNKTPFLMTVSRGIKFATAEVLPAQTKKEILQVLCKVNKMYCQQGFCISTMLANGKYKDAREKIADMGITLNVAARGEHIGNIEQFNRTTKEWAMSVYNLLFGKQQQS